MLNHLNLKRVEVMEYNHTSRCGRERIRIRRMRRIRRGEFGFFPKFNKQRGLLNRGGGRHNVILIYN